MIQKSITFSLKSELQIRVSMSLGSRYHLRHLSTNGGLDLHDLQSLTKVPGVHLHFLLF